ncbi:Co2+/Mg2+ efflux protein ApaG [Alteromonas sp. CYL-A6]|uniref:Co2+/Mg2+ efflux protein ApaG n=1 Tax=Alteromonas nitratireducens TaxID=3390813 RepID=UPI0034C194A9
MSAEDIVIDVETRHLPDHLTEKPNQYAFAYQVTISNRGTVPVQLLSRYWLITDADGKKTEVQGDGVVGKQPVIAAGDSYQYTSGAVLDTPLGIMQGYYEMTDEHGDTFRAPIAPFRLAVPSMIN